MPDYYSAINVPSDMQGLVEIITANTVYYISSNGSDGNDGTETSEALLTLTAGLEKIANKKIGDGITVTYVIMDDDGGVGWYSNNIEDTAIVLDHPDSNKIIIQGERTADIDITGINYYDSTNRAMGDSATGGYLMEILTNTSNLNLSVGDFIKIYDNNYQSGSVDGATIDAYGPTFLETDFANQHMMGVKALDMNEEKYSASPLSIRKTLAFGCHEIVAVDSDIGGYSSVLLHVRHHNPTHSYVDGGSGPAGITHAYVTPQSLRFSGVDALFNDSAYAGHMEGGSEYTGATMGRLGPGGGLPHQGGYTSGATGQYGGFLDDANGSSGSTYGGNSGSNGWKWDLSPTSNDASGYAFSGISAKHLPCRLYFKSSDGLKIDGVKLGKIKDLVICGPGFADDAGGDLPNTTAKGIYISDDGSLDETDNLCVVGFRNGIRLDRNATANVDGTVISSCANGFISNLDSQMSAKHTIASGCSYGYVSENHSNMDNSYSISVANYNDGNHCQSSSEMISKFSISCLNGGNGWKTVGDSIVRLTSTSDFTFPVLYYGATSDETLTVGPTQDIRYKFSDRTGSIAFNNYENGVYCESSVVYGTNARFSYNKHSGVIVDRKGNLDANHCNAYYNGLLESTRTATGITASGIHIRNNSTGTLMYSVSEDNTNYGYQADYASKILASGASGSDGSGLAGATGFQSNKDSIIFGLGRSGTHDTADGGIIRDY